MQPDLCSGSVGPAGGGVVTQDREYFRFAAAWHAQAFINSWRIRTSACGRHFPMNSGSRERALELAAPVETADRIPPTAHLCGNCARSIAARTDFEGAPPVGTVVEDFAGPV